MRPGSARTPGRPNPPASSPGVRAPRQLHQRQRVASGLRDDLLAHLGIDRPGQHRVQQRPRVRALQPLDHQLRQPGQLLGRDPGRKDKPHRLHAQPARHERQDLSRGPIQPLRVIHHANERAICCGLRQQAQHSQADQEPVRHRAIVQPKGDPKRLTLRRRQPFKLIENGRAQLVQRRERELHLRLDSRDADDPGICSLPCQVLQQRRLTHPRLAADHQATALTSAQSLEEGIQFAALRGAANQSRGSSSRRRMRRPWRHNRMLGA